MHEIGVWGAPKVLDRTPYRHQASKRVTDIHREGKKVLKPYYSRILEKLIDFVNLTEERNILDSLKTPFVSLGNSVSAADRF